MALGILEPKGVEHVPGMRQNASIPLSLSLSLIAIIADVSGRAIISIADSP